MEVELKVPGAGQDLQSRSQKDNLADTREVIFLISEC